MRRAIKRIIVLLLTFLIGATCGALLQHGKTGYHFQVQRETTYAWRFGTIRLQYANESVGIPFLDPGTCTIELKEPTGLRISLYKARRGFQESHPYFEDLFVADNQIQWDDGCYKYALQLDISQRGDRRGHANEGTDSTQ